MTLTRSMLLGAALLVATTFFAGAQEQYPPYPNYQAPAPPPSWSYDPYTSGMGVCPQRSRKDTMPCRDILPPTYGQPSYWPIR